MRRSATTLAFAILIAVGGLTPFETPGQIITGLKGGANFADVVINNVVDPDAEADFRMKTGWHAGAFATMEAGERTGVVLEIQYSRKGVRAIEKVNFHYITVPILIRYRLDDRFFAEAGPELGYLFAARSTHGNMNHIWDNNLDIGLAGGIHYEFSDRLFAQARFLAGIPSVIRNASTQGGDPVRYQNRVLQISLGWVLHTSLDH